MQTTKAVPSLAMICLCYGSAANTRKLESDLFSQRRKRNRLGGLSLEQVETKKSESLLCQNTFWWVFLKMENDSFVARRLQISAPFWFALYELDEHQSQPTYSSSSGHRYRGTLVGIREILTFRMLTNLLLLLLLLLYIFIFYILYPISYTFRIFYVIYILDSECSIFYI